MEADGSDQSWVEELRRIGPANTYRNAESQIQFEEMSSIQDAEYPIATAACGLETERPWSAIGRAQERGARDQCSESRSQIECKKTQSGKTFYFECAFNLNFTRRGTSTFEEKGSS